MTAKPERNRKRSEGEEAVISTFNRDNDYFFLVSCSLLVSILWARIHLVSARTLMAFINSGITVFSKVGFPR